MEPAEANINNNQLREVKDIVIWVCLFVIVGQLGTHPFIPSQEGKLNCWDCKLFLKRPLNVSGAEGALHGKLLLSRQAKASECLHL